MATKKQKLAAKKNRAKAVAAMKKAKTPAAKAKQRAKVAALSAIMKSKTTAKPTTAGSAKHALAKVARTEANKTRAAAVKKMQGLKPKSKAWKKARRNVITASSNVRKSGNVMRDVSGRELGQNTSYTGPREAMRKYIKSIEASKGGKGLTKLGDKTEFTKVNQLMLSEMEGDTYAQKRANWDKAWGDPGSDKYKDMQQKQADRHSEMINDPNYDPDFVPKIFDNVPDVDVKTPGTGTAGPSRVGTADGGPYSGSIPGRMAAGGGYGGGYAPGFFGGNPGVLNYATPGFLGSEALNPYFSNYENWSQFMPTNYSLAQQGGALYQPGQYWGGARSGLYGTGGVLPVSGGTGPGGGGYYPPTTPGFPVGDPIYTPPPVTISPPGTTPGGPKYPGVPPGSDQERDRDAGRIHHPEMYNPEGQWIGAEGVDVQGRSVGPLGNQQGSTGQIFGNAPAWDNPNNYDSQANVMPNTGYTPGSSSDPALGYVSPTISPIFDPSTSTSWSGPYVNTGGTGDPAANVNALPTVSTYTGGSTGSAYQGGGDPTLNTNTTSYDGVAAAQQRYLASLNDEDARRMNQMSQAQIANEMANQAAIRSGQGLLAVDVEGDDQGYSESGMGQQGGRGHPGMR